MRAVRAAARALMPVGILAAVAGCGSGSYDSVELMPAPVIFEETAFDPFPDVATATFPEQSALFYVTDRRPATSAEPQAHYADARGYLTRAGVATIRATPRFESWDELRAETLGRTRATSRTLHVAAVEEIGVLPAGITPFHIGAPAADEMDAAGRDFAGRIDRQMALSGSDDIFIYIHGYNVNFEYPLLVAKEMQHFLGYRGAFITFAWPATPSRFAYFKDLATIEPTVRTLRALIDFLDEGTRARRIHLIGYSAGSRIAFGAAYQLALEAAANGRPDERPLATLVLVGSDIDPVHFLQGVADGLLDVSDRVAVYLSGRDSALDLSRWLLSRRRLGQVWTAEQVPPELEDRLVDLAALELIDVSRADGSATGNGHWYFRSSPWVSSDLYLSLLTAHTPERRGLVRPDGGAVWTFPDQYPDRLRDAVGRP